MRRRTVLPFLDDDVFLENDVLARMHRAIAEQQCGFVGSALHGMSHVDDIRPHQQHIAFWDDDVQPERVAPRRLRAVRPQH